MNGEVLHFEAAINPYGCSTKVVEAVEEFARSKQYRFYGETDAAGLRESLAAHHNLSPENFVVSNGAGEALAWTFLLKLVMRPGRLIAPYPSYERFVEAGKRYSTELIEVALDAETFSLPLDSFVETARNGRATLGLISNPNNPSGNLLLDEAGMAKLLDETPDCLWIIDEAYADYAGVSFAPWVRERTNLIVLRTFSKAYGLAGLRVGCAIAHPTVAQQLARVRLPWAVNSASLAAAQAALEDQGYLKEITGRIRDDCLKFYSELGKIPYFHVHPTAANFFLIHLAGIEPASLKKHLAAHRIQVRSRPDMPDHIRVTSMLPHENQHLLNVLREFDG
ncbi:MAG TPA: histidinol-phosphate transaminase [Pyrinomonadaceae bacterium]|nr:histidinol-phosphate transaminase [Pyrinomonadaceae bacterium]